MLGLRLLMQASNAAFASLLAAYRVWVRDTFNRDAFLTSQFAELHRLIVSYFDMCKETGNMDPVCIKVAAMMQTPSFDTLMSGGLEADASVIFCPHKLPLSEVNELFSSEHRDFWVDTVGFNKTVLFNAITMPDFDERFNTFKQSQWAQRLSPEIVELVEHEYDYCERATGTPFMVFLTQKGMTGMDWLLSGLNTTRDNALCMTDALKQYKITINEAVRKRLIANANSVE
jgi:hypothetical protein